jgi:hypothetical protein
MEMQKRLLTWMLTGCLMFGAAPSFAGSEDGPSASNMAADILIARPIGAVITVIGAVTFVASLPFSALGGNVGKAGKTLVVDPGRATFVRCLGCKTSGRDTSPRE